MGPQTSLSTRTWNILSVSWTWGEISMQLLQRKTLLSTSYRVSAAPRALVPEALKCSHSLRDSFGVSTAHTQKALVFGLMIHCCYL